MNQFIINFIEDFILVNFVSSYIYINNKKAFKIISIALCFLETCVCDQYVELTSILPMILIITLLLIIKFFNKKIHLNEFIVCCFGVILIIVTNILSLLIVSFILNISIMQIGNKINYFNLSIILSKLLLFVTTVVILRFKTSIKFKLNIKEWWMLLPVIICVLFIMYFLGQAIVFNDFTDKTFFLILVLSILLVSFFIVLLFQIQKENEARRMSDLNIQKNYYLKKNMETINQLYNEITVIEHSTMYVLLHIKSLLQTKKYDELNSFLEKNIKKTNKYGNVINSGNPYLDHELNIVITSIMLRGGNIKSSIFVKPNIIIEKEYLKLIISIIEYFFTISLNDFGLNMDIYTKDDFLIFSMSFIKKDTTNPVIPDDILNLISNYDYKYTIKNIDNISVFKLITEIDCYK